MHRNKHVLAVTGIFCTLIGLLLGVGTFSGKVHLPQEWLAGLIIPECLATLLAAGIAHTAWRKWRSLKGCFFLLVALLLILDSYTSHLLLAMLTGMVLATAGTLQIITTLIVRFRGWYRAVIGGMSQIALAVFFFLPYPTNYTGTIAFFVSLCLIFGGWSMIRIAYSALRHPDSYVRPANSPETRRSLSHRSPMVIHIWTPKESAREPVRHYPLIDRYVAAIETGGTVSTGHSALEIASGLYISLYPEQETDHTSGQFLRRLRATSQNDIPGRYLPGYQAEAAAWCESNHKIPFMQYNREKLDTFWLHYRNNTVYNLICRNCSSTVAQALDAALEGVIGMRNRHWYHALMLIFTPEIWLAGQIRQRAYTMAWTPGLVLDYARLLQSVIHRPSSSWTTMLLRLAISESLDWLKARRHH